MGATSKLALPWPELSVQADGPAAFQALATAAETKMTDYRSSAAWSNDYTVHVAPGAQATFFSLDVAATAIGWAWLDVDLAVSVGGPQGGRNLAGHPLIENAGGQFLLMQGSTLLRGLRWHSRGRAEIVFVGGGVAINLPPATTVIQLRIICACDSTSDSYGGDVYTANVGLTQFGAARS